MAIANLDIYEELEYKFLYKNDVNSIHILLNLYDLDKNIRNIYPKYISIQNLKSNLSKFFYYKDERINISSCLSKLLHEDINRLELYICLEGYKNGHFNKCLANKLENVTIRNMETEEIYNSKFLYHYKSDKSELEGIQRELKLEVKDNLESEDLNELVIEYYETILRPKIKGINNILLEKLGEEDVWNKNKLTDEEISKMDDFILEMLLKNIGSLYKDSYWYGLNDRVLKRYK